MCDGNVVAGTGKKGSLSFVHPLYGTIDRRYNSWQPFEMVHPPRKQLALVIHQQGGGNRGNSRETSFRFQPPSNFTNEPFSFFHFSLFRNRRTHRRPSRVTCVTETLHFRLPNAVISLSLSVLINTLVHEKLSRILSTPPTQKLKEEETDGS